MAEDYYIKVRKLWQTHEGCRPSCTRHRWKIFFICLFINPITFYGFCYISYLCVECQSGFSRRPSDASCSEAFFRVFNNASFFTNCVDDVALHRRCHAFDEVSYSTSYSRSIAESFENNDHVPDIKTKCGIEKPVLVSWKLAQTSRILNENGELLAPNVVHYVLLGAGKFTFLTYLSFVSVDLFIKPTFIFLHGDVIPTGEWWERTVREIPNVYHVYRERTAYIQNRKTRWIQHSSDILRLQTILDNGGIYLDTDILVVRSFDYLRHFDATLDRETYYGLGNGIIVARPQAPFTCIWLQCYRDYSPWLWNWARFSIWMPNHLSRVLPSQLIHIEEDTLQRPNWAEGDQLFDRVIDWRSKYALHVWKISDFVPHSPDRLEHMNSTVGEVMRMLYYNRSRFDALREVGPTEVSLKQSTNV